jgi:hypothetical protein
LRRNVSYAFHDQANRASVDEDCFAAFYPYPPAVSDPNPDTDASFGPGGVGPVIGSQHTNTIINLTQTYHNTGGSEAPSYKVRSNTSCEGVYSVWLHYWNPLHVFVAYVEVNAKVGGALEHPCWIVCGNNRYAMTRFGEMSELFVAYAPELTEFVHEQQDENMRMDGIQLEAEAEA